jgi:hypothetical protein
VIPEDLDAVHSLTKQIERLRAGEDRSKPPEGCTLNAGQWWNRLLDLNEEGRINQLTRLLELVDDGRACRAGMHEENLADLRQYAALVASRSQQWNTARRLLTVYIQTLRGQDSMIARSAVADKLELFLSTGEEKADERGRRVMCDYTWQECGRAFRCAEPVGPDGGHLGEHYAYVREGASADEALRMRYLEEENDALRARLGLAPNPRR